MWKEGAIINSILLENDKATTWLIAISKVKELTRIVIYSQLRCQNIVFCEKKFCSHFPIFVRIWKKNIPSKSKQYFYVCIARINRERIKHLSPTWIRNTHASSRTPDVNVLSGDVFFIVSSLSISKNGMATSATKRARLLEGAPVTCV